MNDKDDAQADSGMVSLSGNSRQESCKTCDGFDEGGLSRCMWDLGLKYSRALEDKGGRVPNHMGDRGVKSRAEQA